MQRRRRSIYARNFPHKVRKQKELDGWECQCCGIAQYTVVVPSLDVLNVVIDPSVDHPKMIFLHAAHLNHDPANPDAELVTMCPSCHGSNDYHYRERERWFALERFKHRVLLYRRGLIDWWKVGKGVQP
jgi:hypothetical protein